MRISVVVAIIVGIAVLYGQYHAWRQSRACTRCKSRRIDTLQFNPLQSSLYFCQDCRHEWRRDEEQS